MRGPGAAPWRMFNFFQERLFMKSPVQALFWEMTWRNWVVFPALILFLMGGLLLAQALHLAAPDAWWMGYARGTAITLFFTSVLLAFAPFTLMESHGGARLSSMTLRWFALPVRTLYLVAVPLLIAWVMMGVVLAAWTPVLNGIFRGIDMLYMGAVYLAGVGLAQALAWFLPRKPSQFWGIMAMLLPVLFLASIVPQDNPMGSAYRSRLTLWFAAALPCCALLSLWAAHRNRSGDWSGEIPIFKLAAFLRKPASSSRLANSPASALFWSETVPALKSFLFTWMIFCLLIFGWACLTFLFTRPGHFNLRLISKGTLEALPILSVLWPLGWGMLMGCESGLGFQTRLSVFRSTRPVSTGTIVGTRIASLGLSWFCLWGILLVLYYFFLWEDRATSGRLDFQYVHRLFEMLGTKAVVTASAMVGALPWLMAGRIEGFSKVLLITLISWIWTFVLAGYAFQENPPAGLSYTLGAIVLAKFAAAGIGLGIALKRQVITWRFPMALIFGWSLLGLGFVAYFHWLQIADLQVGLASAALLPLVRLAWCPWALSANRHR